MLCSEFKLQPVQICASILKTRVDNREPLPLADKPHQRQTAWSYDEWIDDWVQTATCTATLIWSDAQDAAACLDMLRGVWLNLGPLELNATGYSHGINRFSVSM